MKPSDSGDHAVEEHLEPLVTVGIPAYDSEEYIGQSIDSILGQNCAGIRLLISDNASNDNTQQECLRRVQASSNVEYFRQDHNIGVFQNYNELFRKCNSRYFKWQSSSDWCDSKMLTECIDVLERNSDVVLVCSHVNLVDENGNLGTYDQDFELQQDDPVERMIFLLENIKLTNIFNGVIRSSTLRETNLNQSFRGSDSILLAELALRGKFALIPGRLWYRRMTSSTATKMHGAEQREAFFAADSEQIDKYLTWKKIKSLFVAVWQSPCPFNIKLKGYFYLLRRAIWSRSVLFREIFP